MKNKIERLEMIVVLCLEKIEVIERILKELKPETDGETENELLEQDDN